jgi:hypothetical protein
MSDIIRHGIKTVAIAKLRLPGDIEKRRKLPHVAALGDSFDATGGQPGNAPWVQWGTWKLIAGADRIAAALNLGRKEIDVLLLEGSEIDLERASLVENVRRRPTVDQTIVALLKLEHPRKSETFPTVEDSEEDEHEDPEPAKRGRPNTGKGEAVARVAKAVGKSPTAVRAAVARVEAKAAPVEPEADPDICIDDMDLTIPPHALTKATEKHTFMRSLYSSLIKLQRDLTRFENGYKKEFTVIKDKLHDAAQATKRATPNSLCPYCKGVHKSKDCAACKGKAFLTIGEMEGVPDDAKLLARGAKAGVYVDGKFHLLAELTKGGAL